jgi:hypothetical protein
VIDQLPDIGAVADFDVSGCLCLLDKNGTKRRGDGGVGLDLKPLEGGRVEFKEGLAAGAPEAQALERDRRFRQDPVGQAKSAVDIHRRLRMNFGPRLWNRLVFAFENNHVFFGAPQDQRQDGAPDPAADDDAVCRRFRHGRMRLFLTVKLQRTQRKTLSPDCRRLNNRG